MRGAVAREGDTSTEKLKSFNEIAMGLIVVEDHYIGSFDLIQVPRSKTWISKKKHLLTNAGQRIPERKKATGMNEYKIQI